MCQEVQKMTADREFNPSYEVMNYETGNNETIKRIRPEDLELDYPESTRMAGFVYRILNDKTNGSFIEVGSSHWSQDNNTYVLEKRFGWKGIGLEIVEHFVDSYNENRVSKCVYGDALNFNWDKYLEKNNFPRQIDFLQIDVDDIVPNSNLLALLNIPLSRYRFNVICIENTANINPHYAKNLETQREVLIANGYVLVASLFTDDWWIDKNLNIAPSTYDSLTAAAWYRDLRG